MMSYNISITGNMRLNPLKRGDSQDFAILQWEHKDQLLHYWIIKAEIK